MALSTMDNLRMARYRVKAILHGPMAISTLDSSAMAKKRVKELRFSLTETNMRAIMSTISLRAMVC